MKQKNDFGMTFLLYFFAIIVKLLFYNYHYSKKLTFFTDFCLIFWLKYLITMMLTANIINNVKLSSDDAVKTYMEMVLDTGNISIVTTHNR